jgi:D-glycero-D-manno-heptose 1,7-bisphosphate phosphatase
MGIDEVRGIGRRAVFLDRDGVLNRAVVRDGRPLPPASVEELEIPDDVPHALQALREAGFLLIVVTNQPDVVRGRQRRETVEAINRALEAALPLDEIRVCYHDDADHCDCRKPRPGMLVAAAAAHGIDLESSFMIGDRWRDIAAAHAAGCRAALIDHHYAELSPHHRRPDFVAETFEAAAGWILAH